MKRNWDGTVNLDKDICTKRDYLEFNALISPKAADTLRSFQVTDISKICDMTYGNTVVAAIIVGDIAHEVDLISGEVTTAAAIDYEKFVPDIYGMCYW